MFVWDRAVHGVPLQFGRRQRSEKIEELTGPGATGLGFAHGFDGEVKGGIEELTEVFRMAIVRRGRWVTVRGEQGSQARAQDGFRGSVSQHRVRGRGSGDPAQEWAEDKGERGLHGDESWWRVSLPAGG